MGVIPSLSQILNVCFRTTVDGHEVLKVNTPSGGFWNWGGFHGSNIWASGGRNAPFDQPVSIYTHVILQLYSAVMVRFKMVIIYMILTFTFHRTYLNFGQ